jgi:hypothetical protein
MNHPVDSASGEGLTGEQAAFEKWAAMEGLRTSKYDNGRYFDEDTFYAWRVWQFQAAQLSALRDSHAELTKVVEAINATDHTMECPSCTVAWSERECESMREAGEASCICGYRQSIRADVVLARAKDLK